MNKNDHPWFELEVHPSGHSVTSSWKIGLALFCIILIALAFRWYFFIGFVCADPQDDGIYVSIIRSMVNGTYSLTRIRDVILGNRLNPADNFQLRMGFLVPVRLLVEFFGPSQLSFTLYPILCSIGGILLTYFFINQLAGNKLLGLIAAYLLAIYPIDCVFSTKISPETPLGFFIALTIFFFVRGELQLENGRHNVKTIVSFLLCGAFLSIANSIKTLGIVLPVFFFSYFLLYRKLRWQYLFIIIGFLPVFVVISYYYYINSGDPFLQNTVNAQSQLINYSDPKCVNQMQLGPLEVLYTFGEPLDHTRWAFAFKSYVFDVIFYLTIYYYLFLIGAISWLSYYRKHFTNENNRVMSILLIWVISAFLFLEFAPVSLTEVLFNSKYYMLPKAPRFHNYMSLPVVSFGAIIFYSLRYRKKIMIAGLLLVLVISLVSMHQIKSYYLDGIREMKEAASFIKEHPERIYYTDHLARGELEYFVQLNPNIKIKNINSLRNINGLGSGILILGGARSVDLAGELPMKLIPEWAKKLLSGERENGLVCIKELYYPTKKYRAYRKYNLKMFAYSQSEENYGEPIYKPNSYFEDLKPEDILKRILNQNPGLSSKARLVYGMDCLHVDGMVKIVLKGESAQVAHHTFRWPAGMIHKFYEPVKKDNRMYWLIKKRGRGQARLLELPNANNDFSLIFKVDDDEFPEDDHYRIYILSE